MVGCIIGLHSVLLDKVPFRNTKKKTVLGKLRSGRVGILHYCQTWHEKRNHNQAGFKGMRERVKKGKR